MKKNTIKLSLFASLQAAAIFGLASCGGSNTPNPDTRKKSNDILEWTNGIL